VIGRKRFHLVPPTGAQYLAISTRAPYTNTSTIPLSVGTISSVLQTQPDGSAGATKPADTAHQDQDLSDLKPDGIAQYADLLSRAFQTQGSCFAELGPGESVLIPEGWYHSAESLEVGVGVNAWFR
jgi:hypothetical protein